MKYFIKSIFLIVSIIIISCQKSDNEPVIEDNPKYENSDFPTDDGKDTIWVSNVEELMATIYSTKEGNKVVLIKDGTYKLHDRLWLTGDNLIYRSESEDRDKVVFKGDGMDGGIGYIFSVTGDNFGVKDISLGEVCYHGIHVHGEYDADNFYAQNVRFYNIRQQMIKGSYNKDKTDSYAENGVVEGCLFEYTAGKSFYDYCGGIDIHRGVNWRISDCIFKNFYSPEDNLTEGGIHFWNNSENTLVENNTFINCDRGIMFGLDNSPHIGGIIRNNMIHVTRDVGIYLCFANGVKVYNNTIYSSSDYPNAIEYRFSETINCEIINNLTNKAIANRNDAEANVSNNVTNAESSWFINIDVADLHLKSTIEDVTDKAIDLEEVETDIDGDLRLEGSSDIGADEK